MASEGPSPFLEMPWEPEWDEPFENWCAAYQKPADIDDLIRNRQGEQFELSLKQRNGQYGATLINKSVEDGTGPKLLSAWSNHPTEAILLLYYKWREVMQSEWPKEQAPRARAARR
jgi:hypothetical protein